ncbi:MAG: GFA family protein [Hyphomicrobiaceae bacterium]|nr:GFA family protein [Hyphomicrobiaceae bacterium]
MTERHPVHAGGCQCGAVRYALYSDPANVSICHCRMCQKAFGAFYAPLAGIAMSDFELRRGELAIFKSSDAVERGFCKTCGTPLTFRYLHGGDLNAAPDEINIAIGSLDHPERVKPMIQYGIEARMPWLNDLAALPGKATEDSTDPAVLQTIRSSNHQHPDHD